MMRTGAGGGLDDFPVPMVGFAAFSGTGKTTLLLQLLPLLKQAGLRISVVKHAHHAFDMDYPGNDSHRLRSAGALKELFQARGIDTEGDQIHFCHSGNRAALTWFAAYAVLGNKYARLYDGSMMEWARDDSLPIEQQLRLCEAC